MKGNTEGHSECVEGASNMRPCLQLCLHLQVGEGFPHFLTLAHSSTQERVFPANTRFETPEDQEAYVRDWARTRTGLDCNFRISFYPGRYAVEKGGCSKGAKRIMRIILPPTRRRLWPVTPLGGSFFFI